MDDEERLRIAAIDLEIGHEAINKGRDVEGEHLFENIISKKLSLCRAR